MSAVDSSTFANKKPHLEGDTSYGGAFYPQERGVVELTLVSYKDGLWQDEYGYMWSTNSYGPYMTDTVPQPIREADSYTQVMTRTHSEFADYKKEQIQRAIDTLAEKYPYMN